VNFSETMTSVLTQIRENAECQPDIEKLQGEVLLFKVTGGEEFRFAFRDGTVELDNTATHTFSFEGSEDVLASIFDGQLNPLAAILTRRVKATLDPVRGPVIARIFSVGLRRKTSNHA
jgi:putative sterol carrier protein